MLAIITLACLIAGLMPLCGQYYNYNNYLHLYSAFLGTPSALQRRGNLLIFP